MRTLLTICILFFGLFSFGQTYNVDLTQSSLKWHGKKVTGEHFGTIQLKSGSFELKADKFTSGVFTIDMTSIVNTDIEDAGYKAKLEGHLKSDDFFGVAKFPTATLEFKSSSAFTNNTANVKGKLTIKGISQEIDFKVKKEGNKFTSEIVVDRSKFDVKYGSGKFFENLGDKMIYDDFTLTVIIETSN
jgi:polyisoprenoid-binding protein YceI